jgi:hypothetical protein
MKSRIVLDTKTDRLTDSYKEIWTWLQAQGCQYLALRDKCIFTAEKYV